MHKRRVEKLETAVLGAMDGAPWAAFAADIPTMSDYDLNDMLAAFEKIFLDPPERGEFMKIVRAYPDEFARAVWTFYFPDETGLWNLVNPS